MQSFIRYPEGKRHFPSGRKQQCDTKGCRRIARRFERPHKGIVGSGGTYVRVRPLKKVCDSCYSETFVKVANKSRRPDGNN